MKSSWSSTATKLSSNGWNYNHFFVHGKSVCTTPSKGWTVDLRRADICLKNRRPEFGRKEKWNGTKILDCKKCSAIWIELFNSFKNLNLGRALQ